MHMTYHIYYGIAGALLKDGDEQVKEALTTAQFDYSHLRDKIMDTFRKSCLSPPVLRMSLSC